MDKLTQLIENEHTLGCALMLVLHMTKPPGEFPPPVDELTAIVRAADTLGCSALDVEDRWTMIKRCAAR